MAKKQNVETRWQRDDEFKYTAKVYEEDGDKWFSHFHNEEGIKELANELKKEKEVFILLVTDENGNVEEYKI